MTTTEAKPTTSPENGADAAPVIAPETHALDAVAGEAPARRPVEAAATAEAHPAVPTEPANAETVKAEPAKAEPTKPHPVKAEPIMVEPPRFEAVGVEPAARPVFRSAPLTPPQRVARIAAQIEPRLAAAVGGALVLGIVLGYGGGSLTTSRDHGSAAAIASLATAIDSGRQDTAKLSASVAKLDQTVADLRSASEAARRDTASKGGSVSDRIAQLDRSLTTKLASLSERIEQAERDRTTRMAATTPRPAATAKTEPTQTGSIGEAREPKVVEKAAEAKPVEAKPVETKQADIRQPEAARAAPQKPPVLENLALRDIYEGAAIIENRGRRLFQVMPGDTLPGAGRVEAIERRGRTWVVVTRQGIVTPQEW